MNVLAIIQLIYSICQLVPELYSLVEDIKAQKVTEDDVKPIIQNVQALFHQLVGLKSFKKVPPAPANAVHALHVEPVPKFSAVIPAPPVAPVK